MQTPSLQDTIEPKSSKKGLLLLPLMMVAGLAVGGGLFLFLGQDSGNDDSPASSTSDGSGQATPGSSDSGTTAPSSTAEASLISLQAISQVDASSFPKVQLYASLQGAAGESLSSLSDSDLQQLVIQETLPNGTTSQLSFQSIQAVTGNTSVSLVVDVSDSMSGSQKMDNTKTATKSFVDYLAQQGNALVELTSFCDFIYLEQAFTQDYGTISTKTGNLMAAGGDALYDAVYSALIQAHQQTGPKYVLVITDGLDVDSNYSRAEVVELSQNVGIPIHFIAVDSQFDTATLSQLAQDCGGQFYQLSPDQLATELETTLRDIHTSARNQVVLEFTSTITQDPETIRTLILSGQAGSTVEGQSVRQYIPQANVSGNFQSAFVKEDYILTNSSAVELGWEDLYGLSLAELRIARNEIYARYGRQFNDPMLNQWFYSKAWYLAISPKYSPQGFNVPLSAIESKNATTILGYENYIIENNIIFPNADTQELAEYDLVLSDTALKRALSQMQSLPSTAVLQQNIQLVQDVLNKSDINY